MTYSSCIVNTVGASYDSMCNMGTRQCTIHHLEPRAQAYAIQEHARINHRRKYTNEPYDVHLAEVASILRTVPCTDAVLSAAWCHDLVEDTNVTIQDIARELSEEIAILVFWLTDMSRPEDGNRAVRKAIDRLHISRAPEEA